MKFLKNRVLPFACVFSLLLSFMIVPASAGFGGPVEMEFPSIRPEAFFDESAELLESELNRLFGDNSSDHCAFFSEFAYIANKNNWSETSEENLAVLVAHWNHAYSSKHKAIANLDTHRLDDGTELKFVRVKFNSDKLGGGRNDWTWCLNDGAGKILVALPDEDDSITARGQWLQVNQTSATRVEMLPHDVLFNAAQDLGCSLFRMGNYWVIKKTMGVTEYVYSNADGERFVAQYEEEKWATNQDRPQTNITEDGDIVEGDLIKNDIGIDLSGMTVTLPDGTLNLIDKLIYDESTKTYYIDSHDTYNTENNYYVTNNYSWTYHINYTSITYIGQTEEYNKYYEVYYELPDGRDSADLTKEDLEQLNLSVDVIPYGRSADDTSLRSLYHFDGDTKDSSYWNYCTDFTWNKGASLTYMDAGVFDGALYLDETEHDFTFTLPSYIGASDFTVQFRYYQSATPAPVTDTYVNMGTQKVWSCNGSEYMSQTGTVFSSMPVGSWNEIAFVRSNGTFYWYLNGLRLNSSSALSSINFDNTITFHFGSEQQTFKYFDEFRVLNYAVAENGASYEPTAVPHDTNLTLVLPDSQVPVADEYWSFNTTVPNLLPVWNFTEYYNTDEVLVYPAKTELYADFSNGKGGDTLARWYVFNSVYTSSQVSSAGYNSGSWVFNNNSDQFMNSIPSSGGGKEAYVPGHAFVTPLATYTSTGSFNTPYGVKSGQTYTFSVLLSNGEYQSVTFKLENGGSSKYQYAEFGNGGRIGFVANEFYTRTEHPRYLFIAPPAHGTLEIVYMELVAGSTPNTGHEFVESVTLMDKADLNTPTLAVRTDIDITSYQIGGVRPSIPEKGQVWAMVENERIVSIQIYNGQAWEGVDGRIWTGQRWIPASSYNIITLQDMYDIVDATPNYEYIYSEAGFWAWWQKSWNAFTEKLFQALGSGGSGSGSIVPGTVKQKVSEALSSLIEGIFGTITEVLKSLIGAASDLLSGIFSFFSDTVFGGIRDFFSSFDELINPFETTIENEDGSTTTTPGLPDDVVTGLGFFSGLIMLIPDEVRVVLFFFTGLTLFIVILKRFA